MLSIAEMLGFELSKFFNRCKALKGLDNRLKAAILESALYNWDSGSRPSYNIDIALFVFFYEDGACTLYAPGSDGPLNTTMTHCTFIICDQIPKITTI